MMVGMKFSLIAMVFSVLALSSCVFVQQWQEAEERDARYAEYAASKQGESKGLTALKQAAAAASRAQIRIEWSMNKEDIIIPIGAGELAVIQEIMPRMKDVPPLTRDAWDELYEEGHPLVSFISRNYLEFLDAEGKVMAGKLLLNRTIGVCEHADTYSKNPEYYGMFYMLPAADLARFKELPSVLKSAE